MPPIVEAPSPAKGAPSRRRLAALSAVGAVVVALPLVQVLRFQTEALSAVNRERAGLDPMAHAVDVQQHLILHRDLSSRVLQGQASLEPQRARQQGGVDGALRVLADDFAGGLWPRARTESEALRSDWTVLKAALAERRMAAAQSELAHRLLIEHCLQVTDDLADPAGVQVGSGSDPGATQVQQLRSLSRQIWRTASTAPLTAHSQHQAREAMDVQLQQFRALRSSAVAALDERGSVLARQRGGLLAALAVLLFTSLGLLLHLLRGRSARLPPSVPPSSPPSLQLHLPGEPRRTASHATHATHATQSTLLRMKAAKAAHDAPTAPTTPSALPPPR